MTLLARPFQISCFTVFVLFSLSACQKDYNPSESNVVRLDAPESVPLKFKGYEGQLPTGALEYPDMLPAYLLPSERKVGNKADQYDDIRAANPERYAITIPTRNVEPNARGMVEWEDMQALLLTASGNALPDEVDQGMADMIVGSIRTAGTDVYVLYSHDNHRSRIVEMMENTPVSGSGNGEVHWIEMEHDSIWMIDYSPFPMRNPNNDIAFVDFRYYHPRVIDDGLPTRIGHEIFGIDTFRMPIGFEGGNLQVDSQGTCYATQGLLWYNSWSEEEIKTLFKDYLNCDRVVIVAPLQDEGTTHIDMFFKLVDDHTVILGSYTADQDSGNATLLDNNQGILEEVALPDGGPVVVHRMPMPDNDSREVWRTYINSTFVAGPAGKVNLWPTYNMQEHLEDESLAIWESLMPDWTHQKVESNTIITWGGAMHCISRTVQNGTLARWVDPGSCGGANCSPESDLGYDGSCEVTVGCTGPKWLCDKNDCELDKCQGYSFEGCCKDGNLHFCENNEFKIWECNGQCGWDDQKNYYNCGLTGEGPPEFPIECPSDEPCEPECDGRTCGDNGCGGSCGSCADGDVCVEGSCVFEVTDCESLGFEGCCNENALWWCENGETQVSTCQTACGWDDENARYGCGFMGEGPAEYPAICPGVCSPLCDGKTCGDDGCGGTCGCGENTLCQAGLCLPDDGGCGEVPAQGQCSGAQLLICGFDGTVQIDTCGECCAWNRDLGVFDCLSGDGCLPCEPSCAGLSCGSDGCGGTCGGCGDELTCSVGECVDPDSIGGSSGGCAAHPGRSQSAGAAGFALLSILFFAMFRRRSSYVAPIP